MIIYLSGPISNDPLYKKNFMLFEQYIKNLGHKDVEIINPARFEQDENYKWSDWIRHDLDLLKNCDCLVPLPRTSRSYGAAIELLFAKGSGIPVVSIYKIDKWIKERKIATAV